MNESAKRKRLHWWSLITFVLTLSCCVMVVAGIVLYLAPPGGLARRTGWQFCGLGKDAWMAQHLSGCTVFVLAGLIHLYMNIRILWSYIRSKAARGIRRKWELLASLVLVGFMVTGILWNLPPWSYILEGSQHLQAYRREAENLHGGHGYRRQIRDMDDSGPKESRPRKGRGRRDGYVWRK